MLRVNASRSAGGVACTDARGADVAVKTFTSIGFKVPCQTTIRSSVSVSIRQM